MISQTGGYPPDDDRPGASLGLIIIALLGAIAGALAGYVLSECILGATAGAFIGGQIGLAVAFFAIWLSDRWLK